MLAGVAKRVFTSGPAGTTAATQAAALTDVIPAVKAALTAGSLSAVRAAFGLAIGSAVQAWSATLDAIVSTGATNAMLAPVPAYTLKANLLAATTSTQDVGLSAAIDAMFGSTRGALLARGASGWGLLAPGASGQFLGTGGPGADPSWGTPSGAGNVSTAGSPAAGQFPVFASGTSIAGTPVIAFRNRLRNGAFAINQRGVSGTVNLAAGAYGHDGWKAGANGCTYTFAAAANGIDVTLTITAGTLLQIVRGAELEGGVYTLNQGWTAQARVYQGSASGSYAALPLTTGSLTGGANATIEFSTGTLGLAQFQPGATATAFERRDDELRRCRRYDVVLMDHDMVNATANSATSIFAIFALPPDMVGTPTVSVLVNGTWNISDHYATDPSASSIAVSGVSLVAGRGGRLQINGFSGLTNGRVYGPGSPLTGTGAILVSTAL